MWSLLITPQNLWAGRILVNIVQSHFWTMMTMIIANLIINCRCFHTDRGLFVWPLMSLFSYLVLLICPIILAWNCSQLLFYLIGLVGITNDNFLRRVNYLVWRIVVIRVSVILVVQFSAVIFTMITLIVIRLLRLVVGVSHCIGMILIILN